MPRISCRVFIRRLEGHTSHYRPFCALQTRVLDFAACSPPMQVIFEVVKMTVYAFSLFE